MDLQMRMYWETYFNEFPTEKLIHKGFNPLREYEEEFIDGPMLDIGCGQSNFVLEYISSGRTIYALDNDPVQLQFLKKRIQSFAPEFSAQCHLVNGTFPTDGVLENTYSVIIASNLFHFLTLKQAKLAVASLIKHMSRGTMVLLRTHSSNHFENTPKNANRYSYFKHYYSENDMNELFPKKEFERLYLSEMKTKPSIWDKIITEKWLDAYLPLIDATDAEKAEEKERYLQECLRDNDTAQIAVIYRKL